MSFDQDRSPRWFDPADVTHYNMMKTWLADAQPKPSMKANPNTFPISGKMEKGGKRLFAAGVLVLLACAAGHIAYGYMLVH
jgi:hypothetical protein